MAAAVIFVLAWTICHSFYGVDLVDTGYYYYQYLHPRSANVSYSTYLGTLIGGIWVRIFPGLGLWGLNLLELLQEYAVCVIVYITFRNTFRKQSVILGIVFCMMAISTYVNIFNYHQLNMFLCTSMMCAMYTGLRKENPKWQLLAGACGFMAVLSRFPSILTLVCVLCIVYWRLFYKNNTALMFREIAFFFGGFILAAIVMGIGFTAIEVTQKILNDVFRISSLGGSSSASYGVNGKMENLIMDTLHGSEAALLFVACGFVMNTAMYLINKTMDRKVSVFVFGLAFIVAGVLVALSLGGCFLAMYRVGQAPDFIQLSSFSWFLYGMLFLEGTCLSLAGIIASLSHRKEIRTGGADNSHLRQHAAIAFMGIALVLLCFVGSAARSKHAVLGMWLLAPLAADRLWDIFENRKYRGAAKSLFRGDQVKLSMAIMLVIFLMAFVRFTINTNNFDDPDFSKLTAEIDNDKVRGLKTTQREADAVNEVLDVLKPYAEEEDYLMVLGNPVFLYAMADMKAYIRPWVLGSSYMLPDITVDMKQAITEGRSNPVIIEAKTNPYLGFSEADYYEQLEKIKQTFDNSPRVKYIRDFMAERNYRLLFENDYFSVFVNK